MVLKKVLLIVGVVVLSSCSHGEVSTDTNEGSNVEVNGRLLYTNQCASCHGPKGDLGNSGSKDLTKSKLDEAAVLKVIKEGKGTMSPFEYLLPSDEEREAVLQYVMSMRKGEK